MFFYSAGYHSIMTLIAWKLHGRKNTTQKTNKYFWKFSVAWLYETSRVFANSHFLSTPVEKKSRVEDLHLPGRELFKIYWYCVCTFYNHWVARCVYFPLYFYLVEKRGNKNKKFVKSLKYTYKTIGCSKCLNSMSDGSKVL